MWTVEENKVLSKLLSRTDSAYNKVLSRGGLLALAAQNALEDRVDRSIEERLDLSAVQHRFDGRFRGAGLLVDMGELPMDVVFWNMVGVAALHHLDAPHEPFDDRDTVVWICQIGDGSATALHRLLDFGDRVVVRLKDAVDLYAVVPRHVRR